ncbi:hypothetical protein G5I_10474 [Acromyrmex echinatior]|uniref:Uncharacterized protein n=1 Tax=Acromyrmex echinatior TaxID=103372 RepID=F4WWY5_ACREC|nr:hypothetical protein G5I_10474 [Acromyrmex echinatior]
MKVIGTGGAGGGIGNRDKGRARLENNTLTPRWVLTITATRMAGILLLSLVVATVGTLGVVLWRSVLAAGNHNSNEQSYTYALIIPRQRNHEATFLRPAFLSSLVDDA